MPKQLKVLSIDAALANTGIAIFKVTREEGKAASLSLSVFGVIETFPNVTMQKRVRHICDQVNYYRETQGINAVCMELTEAVTFDKNPTTQMARAASVMKMFSAVYEIDGYLYAKDPEFPVETINPNLWQDQEQIKAMGGRGKSKEWSVKQANAVLKTLGIKGVLKSNQDHTADAINMGLYFIENMLDKIPASRWTEV